MITSTAESQPRLRLRLARSDVQNPEVDTDANTSKNTQSLYSRTKNWCYRAVDSTSGKILIGAGIIAFCLLPGLAPILMRRTTTTQPDPRPGLTIPTTFTNETKMYFSPAIQLSNGELKPATPAIVPINVTRTGDSGDIKVTVITRASKKNFGPIQIELKSPDGKTLKPSKPHYGSNRSGCQEWDEARRPIARFSFYHFDGTSIDSKGIWQLTITDMDTCSEDWSSSTSRIDSCSLKFLTNDEIS